MTPLPSSQFQDPWHAQLFAISVALSEAGHFTWKAWTQAFGDTLKRNATDRPLDGSTDYYTAWLETLETLLDDAGLVRASEAHRVKHLWEAAYLATPHGKPVKLSD